MEFVDVGAHCFYDLCGQQTFLPFKCDDCHHQFCRFHRTPKNHRCPKFVDTESKSNDNNNDKTQEMKTKQQEESNNNENNNKPETKTTVSISQTANKENVDNKHENKNNNSSKKKNKKPFKCSLKGCKKREWMGIVCDECHLNYCRKHRFGDDHNCSIVIENMKKNNTRMNDIGVKRQALIDKVLDSMRNDNDNNENQNHNNNNNNGQRAILVR